MFGFSLQKLIFTGLAIAVVIYGFKWYNAMQQRRAENARRRPSKKANPSKPAHSGTNHEADEAELMIECKTCGTYVAAGGTRSCGREDCPY